jgi:hypothetical protein
MNEVIIDVPVIYLEFGDSAIGWDKLKFTENVKKVTFKMYYKTDYSKLVKDIKAYRIDITREWIRAVGGSIEVHLDGYATEVLYGWAITVSSRRASLRDHKSFQYINRPIFVDKILVE